MCSSPIEPEFCRTPRQALVRCTCSLLTVCGLAVAGAAVGQVNPAPFVDASAAVVNQFQPVAGQQIDAAYQALEMALRSLEQRLETSSQHASGWKAYLDWEAQLEHLEKRQPTDIPFWQGIAAKLVRNFPGLEQQVFREYRSCLQTLLKRLRVGSLLDGPARYAAATAPLKTVAASGSDPLAAADLTRCRAAIEWLAAHGQSHAGGKFLEQQRGFPNVRLYFRPQAVLRIQQPGRTRRPISGYLSGHYFSGFSQTDVTIGVETLPATDPAVLRLNLQGHYATSTRSRVEGVRVDGQSQFPFHASADARLNLDGLQSGGVVLSGRYRSCTPAITTPHGGIRGRVEHKRGLEGYRASYAAAKRRTENGLRRALQTSLDQQVADFNAAFQREVLSPLLRLDLGPRQSRFASDERGILLRLTLASESELAAPAAPEFSPLPGEDFSLVLHESAIQNYLRRLQPVGKVSLQRLMQSLGCAAVVASDALEVLTLDLPDGPALECFFRNGETVFVLHANQISYRGQRFSAADVRVTYVVEAGAKQGGRLSRRSAPEVGPSSLDVAKRRLGVRDIALRRVLTKVFDRELPREIDLTSLTMLPATWQPAVSSAPLQATAAQGWLRLSRTAASLLPAAP